MATANKMPAMSKNIFVRIYHHTFLILSISPVFYRNARRSTGAQENDYFEPSS
jgi:hypothetical protein